MSPRATHRLAKVCRLAANLMALQKKVKVEDPRS